LPLSRLGTRAQAPNAPVDLFRDWQENTNSILLGSQTAAPANGCLVLFANGNHGREANTRAEAAEKNYTRAPPERVGRAFSLLTKTYHGRRVTGKVAYSTRRVPKTPFRRLPQLIDSMGLDFALSGVQQSCFRKIYFSGRVPRYFAGKIPNAIPTSLKQSPTFSSVLIENPKDHSERVCFSR
jgi:hypothetical protein